MTIDWTVSVGQILGGVTAGAMAVIGTYGAVLKIYYLLDKRLTLAETHLESHTETLKSHAGKMLDHEGRMIDIIASVAQLFGSLGIVRWNGKERRHPQTDP